MTTADLVPVANLAEVEALDPAAREVAVTRMLSEARSWLAHAVQTTEPARIAEFKAFVATVAESTRQLNLAKGIQLDALEMVRRAERGVGVAIRKGQESGEILRRSEPQHPANQHGSAPRPGGTKSGSVADLLPNGRERDDTYRMTDGVSDEQFEDALTQAKGEENLSRANLLRKLEQAQQEAQVSAAERADEEQFWDGVADKARASGAADRIERERPYALAVVSASHAAEQILALGDPADIGANVPATNRHRLEVIAQAHTWLGQLLAAARESENAA